MKAQIGSSLVALMLAMSLTGCLKTRAQLREEGPDQEQAPAPGTTQQAQVQDVQPQGQYVIDEIKNEITRLNGRIEDLERAKAEQGDKANLANQEALKKLDQRMTDLEQAQMKVLENLQKMQAAAPAQDNGESFEKGRNAFEAGDYDAAIESFSLHLKNPKAKHPEEATFLRAESYFNQKQYKKAIVDYSKFPEKFTHSKRMPTALYKIGLSFDALGMKEDARGFYQELVEKFPKSPEAKKVRSKLK